MNTRVSWLLVGAWLGLCAQAAGVDETRWRGATPDNKVHKAWPRGLRWEHGVSASVVRAFAEPQDWSEFGEQDLTLRSATSTTFTQDLNYDDTWSFAFGIQYRLGNNWLWSVGAAYATNPADDDTRTPDLPLDRQIRIGTGIQLVY